MVKTIGDRIREERKALGIERPDLARMTKIGYSTLSEIERGGMKSSTKLHTIAAALGVSPSWLETGKGPKEPVAGESGWSDVRGFAQAAGLGAAGAEADEYAEAHKLKFRAASLSRKGLNPEKMSVFYGKGDSMLPRIHSGDAIMFDTSETRPKHGVLYVIQIHGVANREYQVKRAMIIDDETFFVADNPAGDHTWNRPRKMRGEKYQIEVLGRVRWIGSWED